MTGKVMPRRLLRRTYNEKAVRQIIAELSACPDWTLFGKCPVCGAATVRHLERIIRHPMKDVRQGIASFISVRSGRQPSIHACAVLEPGDYAKVFLLTQYSLNIAGRVSAKNYQRFGGWRSGVKHSKSVEECWPFSTLPNGKLVLTGRYGGYIGGVYDLLSAFDDCYKKYGRRRDFPK
jgi:hypothetical protein